MFGFDSLFRSMEYGSWLDSLREEIPSAVALNKKECIRCGLCCAIRPCIPTPIELEEIAKFLSLDVKEAVKRFFVYDSLDNVSWFLFPAKETQTDLTGKRVPCRRTYDKGFCIFFDKVAKKCKIYSVRPEMAKKSACWEENGGLSDEECDSIRETWKGIDFSKYGIDTKDEDIDED